MMDAQLNIIGEYLRNNNIEVTRIDDKEQCIDFKVHISESEYILTCTFTNGFPYEFPVIRLNDSLVIGETIPHLSNEGNICVYDTNIVVPDFDKPNEIVLATIERATEILLSGIMGDNKQDLTDEIKAYWELEAKIYIYLFSELGANAKTLKYYKHDNLYYVCDEETVVIKYFEYNFNIIIDRKKFLRCLYLPFKNQWVPPYPKNYKELYDIISEDKYCKSNYEMYIKKNNIDNIVLFSNKIDDEYFVGAWFQFKLGFAKNFGIEQLNFRLLQLPPNTHKSIIRCAILNLNKNRTYKRGGDGTELIDLTVNVIGCGSIGSYLVEALREVGVYNFNLIDNEILTDENISRHAVGANYILKNKAEAIEKSMMQKYPGMKITSINKNVFDVIKHDIKIFNDADWNFIVVGNIPIEMAFINMKREELVAKPIAIIWVEPYLIGGHIMIIMDRENLDSIISNYIGKHSILVEPHKYIKREAGCQGTYMPYSAFEIKKFIYSTMGTFKKEFIEKTKSGNYLISWGGNLSDARKKSLKISDDWLVADDNTIRIQELL